MCKIFVVRWLLLMPFMVKKKKSLPIQIMEKAKSSPITTLRIPRLASVIAGLTRNPLSSEIYTKKEKQPPQFINSPQTCKSKTTAQTYNRLRFFILYSVNLTSFPFRPREASSAQVL
jgi:hypothetical protein